MAFDNNRSRDVKGPELKRPYDVELQMAKTMLDDTNVLEQIPLANLHCGEYEGPLAAAGEQHVKVDMKMGKDMAGNQPKLAKSPKYGESKSANEDKEGRSEAQEKGHGEEEMGGY